MQRVIEVAKAEIGYKSDRVSKYFSELFPDERPMPWCVPFVEWAFIQAYGKEVALKMLCIPDGKFVSSVTALVRFFKRGNLWHWKMNQAGWLVFLRTNHEWTNHVELIVSVSDTEITSIGGNCNNEVRMNTYQWDDARISGYGEIIYKQ